MCPKFLLTLYSPWLVFSKPPNPVDSAKLQPKRTRPREMRSKTRKGDPLLPVDRASQARLNPAPLSELHWLGLALTSSRPHGERRSKANSPARCRPKLWCPGALQHPFCCPPPQEAFPAWSLSSLCHSHRKGGDSLYREKCNNDDDNNNNYHHHLYSHPQKLLLLWSISLSPGTGKRQQVSVDAISCSGLQNLFSFRECIAGIYIYIF